jgi:hypothetical protein
LFDVNQRKRAGGRRCRRAAATSRRASGWLTIEAQLERLGACPLGHISSGPDRKGNQFLSVYAQTVAL